MFRGVSILTGATLLAGCAVELPGFVGRDNTGQSTYVLGGGPSAPDPVALPLRRAEAERGLHGVIVVVEGLAPTQGFYGAQLVQVAGGGAEVLGFELVAVPPDFPGAVGPERTRQLSAAVFVPNGALRRVSAARIAGATSSVTVPLR